MSETSILKLTELPAKDILQYTAGFKHFKEIELSKWLLFKKDCKAYANNAWINNTCRITDNDCQIDTCFVIQVVKLIRGYF